MSEYDFKTIYDGHWAVKFIGTNPDNYKVYWVDNITSENITEYAAPKKLFVKDAIVSFVAEETPTYNNFPYRADVTLNGVTSNMTPYVFYSDTQVLSQKFSPFVSTGTNIVSLWANEAMTDVTIPLVAAELIAD